MAKASSQPEPPPPEASEAPPLPPTSRETAENPETPETSELDPEVAQSLAYCHQITRNRARNFYYGLKLTPEPRRSAGYAIYAFMRACDDLVDQPLDLSTSQNAPTHDVAGATGSPGSPGSPSTPDSTPPTTSAEAGLNRIEAFRQQMLTALGDGPLPPEPIWPAFRHTVKMFDIDPTLLHDMLDGQRYDLFKTRYETFDELYDYCYKVASVVGLVCIRIWGAGNVATARKMAEHRGIAFQLTNILRDLAEDAQRDRVYIPAQELNLFGYDPAGFRTAKRNAGFDALMRFQIDRARKFFVQSDGLETYIDSSCRPASWAIMRIYRDLLDKINASPFRVLNQRVQLSVCHKLGIAGRALWRGRRA